MLSATFHIYKSIAGDIRWIWLCLHFRAVGSHGQFKLTKNNYNFTTCLLHTLIPEIISQLFSFFSSISSSRATLSNEIWLHVASNHFLEIWNIGHFLCFHVQSRSSKACFEICLNFFLRKCTTCYFNYRYHWAQKRRVMPDTSQYRKAFSITGRHPWSQMNVPVSEVTSTE